MLRWRCCSQLKTKLLFAVRAVFFTLDCLQIADSETPQAGMGGLAAFLNLSPGGWGIGLKSAAHCSEIWHGGQGGWGWKVEIYWYFVDYIVESKWVYYQPNNALAD